MITEWCGTAVGRSLSNLYLWTGLIQFHVDDVGIGYSLPRCCHDANATAGLVRPAQGRARAAIRALSTEAMQLKDRRALNALPSRAAVDIEKLGDNAPAALLASAERPSRTAAAVGF